MEKIVGIVDKFTKQLKNSGYDRKKTRDIVVSGLLGFERKVERRKAAGEDFYRGASSTLGHRVRKKLTQKTTWFREKEKVKEKEKEEFKTKDKSARRRNFVNSKNKQYGKQEMVKTNNLVPRQ